MRRFFGALAAMVLVGCPPFSEDPAFYLCRTSSECGASAVCFEDRCCAPKTCADLPDQCGNIDDGCGDALLCGCDDDEICGAVEANRCSCAKDVCNGRCGEVDDGCGGKLACECSTPNTCGGGGTAGMCGCTPDVCGARCGRIADGCAGSSTCPNNCVFPAVCGGVTPNQCGVRAICDNIECGLVADGDRQVWCASCATGQACESNRCVPATRPFCWGPPEVWTAVEEPFGPEMIAVPRVENGELFLYVARENLDDSDPACRRHGRLPLRDWTTPVLERYEALESSNFDDLSAATCRQHDRPCHGKVWAGAPINDGLEMIYDANYPCFDWSDNELYISTRASIGEPWSRGEYVPNLGTRNAFTEDSIRNPVLMPDRRTLQPSRT